ncbi:unnamed protein product [Brugia timori]|uniref:Uncharacterized protein n=1 Tax=Brugia timori TaxID=42155 RepID=A0A0R3QR90_9BILA|nr:unnamed protein product [Brugia timori]
MPQSSFADCSEMNSCVAECVCVCVCVCVYIYIYAYITTLCLSIFLTSLSSRGELML